MQLSRAILPTPIGEMLALSSDEGLCALEFTTVQGKARGEERLTRLDARLAKWFPPHELVERETPVIARTRRWLKDYFDGASADVSGIPLDMRGAPFDEKSVAAVSQDGEARAGREKLRKVLARLNPAAGKVEGP